MSGSLWGERPFAGGAYRPLSLREVEILHDQLLARFAADPALTPDRGGTDPDIERYAPFIGGGVRPREGSPRILTASPTAACAPRCR